MGNQLCASAEEKEQNRRNAQIERELKNEKDEASGNQKMLLLGTGECGKSTILKQLRILHSNGYTVSERQAMVPAICSNIVSGMAQILRARDKYFYISVSKETEDDIQHIIRLSENCKMREKFGQVTFEALLRLREEQKIIMLIQECNTYPHTEHLVYFLWKLEKIYDDSFVPSVEDILKVRIATTGVVKFDFDVKGTIFSVIDVGGQRSERRKWIHQFDNVNALIYICAINEYDQQLNEDQRSNRMEESFALFDKLCNSRFFHKTSTILFLNKKDLFEKKIQHTSIRTLFKNYAGQDELGQCIEFLTKEFEKLNTNHRTKRIYTHATCATDTNQVNIVIEAVIDIVVSDNLRGTGMEKSEIFGEADVSLEFFENIIH
ncbi:unnamed protein product [Caenorhabditis angaria]|uniref:Uncharacterized protein n=1 Tax=Caenorhabditis angaria TaxID=860376 RepID=A0A9P1MTR8_9PELO|nr:unnamed protein product [Caenorhabditis angaria]